MQGDNMVIHRAVSRLPLAWDTLATGTEFHLCRAWLAAAELTLPDEPCYITQPGTYPEGAAVGYVTRRSAASDRDSLNRNTRVDHLLAAALGNGRREFLDKVLPSLSCGGWTLVNSTMLLRPGLDPDRRRSVRAELLAALQSCAVGAGARSMNFPYVEDHNEELRELLLGEGFLPFPVGAHSAITVSWNSFAGYLAHLPKNRRSSVRSELARLSDAGVRYRVAGLDEELAERLVPMGAATVERHQGTVDVDGIRARLLQLAQMGSRVVLAEHDGVVRGFGVIIIWKGQMYARMVGFDYDFQQRLPLFFGVMYEQIRFAIENGIGVIEYATTAERAKAFRGARIIGQNGFIKVFDGADADTLSVLLAAPRDDESAARRA
ncbi:GNAT family N-acetyltransferase [Micromonospora sp. HNM0581]|uniref:GNAT family N-acetyltransferase n=1 Tax=Micromonospora sp. HNM0581 TaxID=2716341 RepID=UPI00146A8DB2|nr:GNAT family N-acetyltransferase [Micromonospora sp. HNM0581]NLU80789.1 GNAT family N-acetyltransferase [Micromonospora sp. HNM0581]